QLAVLDAERAVVEKQQAERQAEASGLAVEKDALAAQVSANSAPHVKRDIAIDAKVAKVARLLAADATRLRQIGERRASVAAERDQLASALDRQQKDDERRVAAEKLVAAADVADDRLAAAVMAIEQLHADFLEFQ